jgi:hypothetical protein
MSEPDPDVPVSPDVLLGLRQVDLAYSIFMSCSDILYFPYLGLYSVGQDWMAINLNNFRLSCLVTGGAAFITRVSLAKTASGQILTPYSY